MNGLKRFPNLFILLIIFSLFVFLACSKAGVDSKEGEINEQNNSQTKQTKGSLKNNELNLDNNQQAAPVEEFQEDPNLNADVNLIRKFYYLLENNKIEEAFKLQMDKNYLGFENKYQDLEYLKPDNFKEIKLNYNEITKIDPNLDPNGANYEFTLSYKKPNQEEEKYRIKAAIIDFNGQQKIKIISQEKYLIEPITFSNPNTNSNFTQNLKAYAVNRNGKNYMLLERYGKEIIVDQAQDDFENEKEETLFYDEAFFSPNGNYLLFKGNAREISLLEIYSILQQRIVISENNYGDYGFSSDEKYFYSCQSAGFGPQKGLIYNLSWGRPIFDLYRDAKQKVPQIDEYLNINCSYNQTTQEVIFSLTKQANDPEKQEVVYSLTSNRLK
jgi:hypothetical protein